MRQLYGTYTPENGHLAYEYDASWRQHTAGFVWNATVTRGGMLISRPSGITRLLALASDCEETMVRQAVEAQIVQLAGLAAAAQLCLTLAEGPGR